MPSNIFRSQMYYYERVPVTKRISFALAVNICQGAVMLQSIQRRLYGQDDSGFESCPKCPDLVWGLPSLLLNALLDSFPGLKQSRLERDHSPSCCATVKNEWIYTSTPLCANMAWTGNVFMNISLSVSVSVEA